MTGKKTDALQNWCTFLKPNARQLRNTNFPTKRYRRKFVRTVSLHTGHNDVSSLLLYYLHKTSGLKYIYIYKTSNCARSTIYDLIENRYRNQFCIQEIMNPDKTRYNHWSLC